MVSFVCHFHKIVQSAKLFAKYCFQGTLGGLFSQILQGEDVVRERAIKFLSAKLRAMPEESLTKEVEDYILTETKKVE